LPGLLTPHKAAQRDTATQKIYSKIQATLPTLQAKKKLQS